MAFTSMPLHASASESGVNAVLAAPEKKDGKLSGTVVDKKTSEQLYGVSVAVWQNGKLVTGAATGFEGEFSINAPEGNFEVRVSYIGYKPIVIKSNSIKKWSGMEIVLEEDGQQLETLVVNGFFAKDKNSFTGSVTQLKGDELKAVSGVNIVTAIASLTPGMQLVENTMQGSNPNHVPELVMRGMSSFSNEGQSVNQPTIILDGTEISMQELYDLDMNEVESINVLKDASATALYGSKAANGVIVITRKPIKESTLRVAYNFTGQVQIPKLGDYDVLNAMDKLKYERMAGLYDGKGEINTQTGLPVQYELDELYNERYKAVSSYRRLDAPP